MNPQSHNRYSYVYNNPLNYTDPSGHCRYDDEGNFEYATDCTVNEFAALSWDDRMLWMGMFMSDTGVEMFWNIIGILQFFKDDSDFSSLDGWASFSDAGVLQAIQDGWRIHNGENPIGHYLNNGQNYGWASGGNNWASFFDLYKLFSMGEATRDEMLEQWGIAEQAGVDYGMRLAASYYDSSSSHTRAKIDYFVSWGNRYRDLVSAGINRVEVNIGGTDVMAMTTDPSQMSTAYFVYYFSKWMIANPVDAFEPGPIPILTDYYDVYP